MQMIQTSYEGFTFFAPAGFPEFVARQLSAEFLEDNVGDWESEVEQISFIAVAAISRAAYISGPKSEAKAVKAQREADRAWAVELMDSGDPIVLGADFEQLLRSLGSTIGAITGFPERRERAIQKRKEAVEARNAALLAKVEMQNAYVRALVAAKESERKAA